MPATTLPIHPVAPCRPTIEAAARCVQAGGLLVFPTTGLYGLGVDAFNPRAVARIFAAKQRPAGRPVLVLIRDALQLENLVAEVPPAARTLMEAFWPGRLTLVFKARPGVPPGLTAGTGKLGVRLPGHPVAAALVRRLAHPLTGTSANLSDRGGCSRMADLNPLITAHADLILDAGALQGGAGSTVVDVTTTPVCILRAGAVAPAAIHAALE